MPKTRPSSRPATLANARRPGATRTGATRTGSTRTDGAATQTAAGEIQALSGDPNFMTSLARGLTVIRAFSQHRHRQSIAQLSHRTGIPRAAVRRCLYTLQKLGYVAVDEGRAYALRPQILGLGHAYLSSAPLATSAQPLLNQVSEAIHESCSMAILDGEDILYVARSSASTRIMSIDLGIGSRLPAFCTSMGRVLLAGLSSSELAAYLRRVKFVPHTNRTIVTRDQLKSALDIARAIGFAVVDQELEIGLRSIAVPVADRDGRVAAAINVSVQAGRMSLAHMETAFLSPLRAAARELGMLLSAS